MKQPQLQISIPEPCHENWNEMSPTEKGRFCKVCTKEVIDFTSKSDEEIINHVKKHNNACGRFYPSQLNRKLIADRKKRNYWLSYAASLLLPMTLFSQEKTADKKNPTKVEQLDSLQFKRLDINSSLQRKAKTQKNVSSLQIKGVVQDEKGIPFPSVTITVNNEKVNKTTDFDGNFSLQVKKGDIVSFSFSGYLTKEINIVASQKIYNVTLAVDLSAEEVPLKHYDKKDLRKKISGVAGMFVTIDADDIKRTKEVIPKEIANPITISGNVTDHTKMPLPGATIAIKGTDKGKMTDFDGDFSIKAKVGDTLVVSYVGYETEEVKVIADTTTYAIQLKEVHGLEVVSVVGGYSFHTTSYCLPNQETPEKKARKKRLKNYFAFQRKKWLEKRAKRKAVRAARRAKRKANK